MQEQLCANENNIEEPEGLRLLLTQIGLKHIAEALQQLPQSTYESITSLVRSALDRLSSKYQQMAWSLVLATALTACTGIKDASAQTKDTTIDQPGKPTVLTPTPTPTATKRPEATPTPIIVEVIDVVGGINRRKAPNGEVIGTTPGSAQNITTYTRTTEQPIKAGSYTWYQATDGTEIFWVAQIPGKVTLRTEVVSQGTGGELDENKLLAKAQKIDSKVVGVMMPQVEGAKPFAYDRDNKVLLIWEDGEWKFLEQNPVGTTDSIDTQAEVPSQTMTLVEFSQNYPEIAAKITEEMALVDISRDNDVEKSTLTNINGRDLAVIVRSDGIFQLALPDGKVLFSYVDGKNKDESLNDWAKPELISEKGLLQIWVSTDYHNLSHDRLLPDRPTNHLVDVLPADPAIIDKDTKLIQAFRPQDPAIIKFLTDHGFLAPGETPAQFESPLKKLDDLAIAFFELLGSGKQLPESMPIKLQDGTETTFDPRKGIIFIINAVPSRGYEWLAGGAITVDSLPSQPYTIDSHGRLIVYIVTGYDINSWTANTWILRGLNYALQKNGVEGDQDTTELSKDNKNIPSYIELKREVMQLIEVDGKIYVLPNILIAQSKKIGQAVNYYFLSVE